MNQNLCQKQFTIITTNDMHSSFTGSGGMDYELNSSNRLGHYSRLCTSINLLRNHYQELGHAVLVVDAGDWYSGSLFQLLAPSEHTKWAPELEYFDSLNYDAVTLGNHDLEAGEESLLRMFEKVEKLSTSGPNFLSSNMRVRKLNAEGMPLDEKTCQIAQNLRHRVRDHVIIVRNGIRFGIIGAMGTDAAFSCSGTRRGVTFIGYDDETQSKQFNTYVKFITEVARKLRPDVDVLILLAHQGTPEDVDLAKAIPRNLIDVMISGHTHESYLKKVSGCFEFSALTSNHHTFITQSGSHGKRIGVTSFLIPVVPSDGLKFIAPDKDVDKDMRITHEKMV